MRSGYRSAVAGDRDDSRGSSGPWFAARPSTTPKAAYNHPPSRHSRRRKWRGGRLTALALVVVAGAAWAAVRLLPHGPVAPRTGFVPTGSSPGQDAEQTATAFLRAWTSGNLGTAARYTDHPA